MLHHVWRDFSKIINFKKPIKVSGKVNASPQNSKKTKKYSTGLHPKMQPSAPKCFQIVCDV